MFGPHAYACICARTYICEVCISTSQVDDVRAKLNGHVAELNADLSSLRTFGPSSRYEIEGFKGTLELKWGEGFMEGQYVQVRGELVRRWVRQPGAQVGGGLHGRSVLAPVD